MAIEKTIELKVNATQADKALEQFGGTLEDVYGEGVQPLNFAIGELEDRLYEMAAAGQTGSKEFKEMAAEVGKMKKVIIETDLAVDGMAMTTSQQLSGSMMGVVSGFELAQGAMGAFGAESEQVEEMLLKVQSASAIADGLQGIKESVASFKALKNSIMATTVVQKALTIAGKAFNAVMKANPIGLIITAIAALIAGIVALVKNFRAVTDWLGITESASREAHKQMIKDSEELRAAREKAFNKDMENMDLEIKRRKALGEDTYKIELKMHKDRVKFAKEQMKMMLAEYKMKVALGEIDQETNEKFVEQGKAMLDMFKSSRESIVVMEAAHQKEINDKRKAAYEKNKARKDKEVEDEKKRKEEERRLEEEYLKFKEDAENALLDAKEALDEQIYQAGLSAREKEMSALDTYYFDIIERARQHGLDVTALEEEQRTKTKELQDKWAEEDEAKRKEQREKDKEDLIQRQENERKKYEMASAALGTIGDLVNAFAGESEQAQERAFKVTKAVNLAQAITNTGLAVTAALTAGGNPLKLATGAQFVEAGIAAAAGAAQIATIAKTKFQGAGGGGGGGSIPSPPSGGGARPAEFNIIGNSGTNQLAETLNRPAKAYVVGSEVTTQQSLDRNKVRNASI